MKVAGFRACGKRGVFVAISVLFIIACSSDERVLGELSQGCLINSDCNSPLVCAFRKCHIACEATRDCPAGLRCVASDRPFHVCQLESERACVYNTNCPEGQVCAADAQCRDQCQAEADCLAGQLCVSGACAEPSELRGGMLPVVAKDAGPSTGQSCSYNSQCPAGLVCRMGACRIECIASADCGGGRQCIENRCQVPLCPESDAGGAVDCSFSSDCPAPLVCRGGTCTCECRFGADCPSGDDCISSRCVLSGVDTIGPEGGLVVSPDRRLTLEVPPGALAVRVHVTVDLAEAWPAGALGPVFEVRPSGTMFAVPVTFVYRYLEADLAPVAPVDVRLAVAIGSSWTRLPTAVNAAMGTATSHTTHLSTYGLVGPDVGGVPDASADGREGGGGPDAADGGDADRCGTAVCSGTTNDGCCPPGCNLSPATRDVDCAATCGNAIVDTGETCDGNCPTSTTCASDADTIRTLTGDAATCDAVCNSSPRSCTPDGFCPSTCDGGSDPDCPPPNDQCKSATDISSGGTFRVDITGPTKQDSVAPCSSPGPELFYTFRLDFAEYVYFSVLDGPGVGSTAPAAVATPVPAALEIYPDQCPPPDGSGQISACDAGAFGEQTCQGAQFPLITSSTTGLLGGQRLGPGLFFLAVRSFGGPRSFSLTYNHVPLECAQEGEIIPPITLGQVATGNTCGTVDNVTPTCATTLGLEDANFVIFKCPDHHLNFTTCDGLTPPSSDTSVSAMFGSIVYSPSDRSCSGQQVACGATPLRTCQVSQGGIADIDDVANADSGIVTLSVQVQSNATGAPCGDYGLEAIRQ